MHKSLLTIVLLLLTSWATAEDVNYCIKYTTTEAHADVADDQACYTLTTPLSAGHSYKLVIKVKSVEACPLEIWATSSTGTDNAAQLVNSKRTSDTWGTFRLSFTAEKDFDQLNLRFGGLNGWIYFDNVSLAESGIGVNMVTNGEFTDPVTTGWSTPTADNGTAFEIVDVDAPAPLPGEPNIPDTWEFVKQGDPNFHVYLCFGQSNMEGNAQPEAEDYQNVPENFKMMAAVDFNNPKRKKGEWYTATPPLCRQGTGLTPADYFGRTLVEQIPDITVGVINVAVGGARIELFMDEYKDEYIAGEADWFKNYCAAYGNDPLGRLVEMGKKAQQVGTIKGILLHQGESNNGASDWCMKVGKIYKRICYYLGLDPREVPLLAGETLYQDQGGGCSWHNVAALPHLKEEVPNSYVISAEGIPGNGQDPWHFSAAGYREFGRRYAQQMMEILDEQAAAIQKVEDSKPVDTKAFNLSGQRITNNGQHAIVVVDGKKVVR